MLNFFISITIISINRFFTIYFDNNYFNNTNLSYINNVNIFHLHVDKRLSMITCVLIIKFGEITCTLSHLKYWSFTLYIYIYRSCYFLLLHYDRYICFVYVHIACMYNVFDSVTFTSHSFGIRCGRFINFRWVTSHNNLPVATRSQSNCDQRSCDNRVFKAIECDDAYL